MFKTVLLIHLDEFKLKLPEIHLPFDYYDKVN